MPRLTRLQVAVATAAATLLVGAPPPASAQEVVTSCANEDLRQPFVPWADHFHYVLAPGGDFESGSPRWTLTGGADVVAGNEPYRVHGPKDARSLALPSGASATTPPICLAVDHPTLRLFMRRTSADFSQGLAIDALYHDAAGTPQTTRVGYMGAGREWMASATVPVLVNLALLPSDAPTVAFRFTSSTATSWQIDDVYVDPWRVR